MSKLSTRAEIIKLARLLKLEEAQLAFMQRYSVVQIRELRERMSATLFDGSKATLSRVATASKLIPVPLVAIIGEKVYGPLLCARVTGLLPPTRAVEIGERLSVPFLADLSMELDPRSAREVISLMPTARVVAIARELLKRGEFITMARFVDYLRDQTIKEVMAAIGDDRALLEIAFFIESHARLETIMELVPLERLRNIIRVAAGDGTGLWPEALAMMLNVGDTMRRKMGDLTAELDDAALNSIMATIQRESLWTAWVTVVSAMTPAAQKKLLGMAAMNTPAVLAGFAGAARDQGLRKLMTPLLAFMGEAPRKQLEDLIGRVKSTVKNLG
ncbi:MAG: hypothetical protein ACRESS_03140 [Stenotrophobium sp.]